MGYGEVGWSQGFLVKASGFRGSYGFSGYPHPDTYLLGGMIPMSFKTREPVRSLSRLLSRVPQGRKVVILYCSSEVSGKVR